MSNNVKIILKTFQTIKVFKIDGTSKFFNTNMDFRHIYHHILDLVFLKQLINYFDCHFFNYWQAKRNNYIIFIK